MYIQLIHSLEVKGIYLLKALTCMKFFLYKQKMLFYQGDRLLYEQFIHLT